MERLFVFNEALIRRNLHIDETKKATVGDTLSQMFASFSMKNYRLFFIGAFISNVGTWLQRIGQDWLVLTDLTSNSSSALGFVTALQFLAVPLLAPWAGGIIDRFSKQKILFITQLLLALNALVLWALVFFGVVELWHVFVSAFLQGVITAFDNPARQSFVPEVVSNKYLANAIGLNSTSFNAARLFGPGIAGFMIAAFHDDVAPVLLINTLTFVAMLVALALMDRSELTVAPRAEKKGATRGGLAYVKSKPDIIVLLVIIFMLGTFGMNFQIYNATMATEVFGKGSEEYGMLGTVMAIGTLGGALMAARRAKPRLKVILWALLVFGVLSVVLAFSTNYYMYAILLIPIGFASLTVMTSANAAVQLSSEPLYRGRVMAIYMAIFMGGTPLGSPLIGWIGDAISPRASILLGGGLNLLTALGILTYFIVSKGLRLSLEYERHHLPHVRTRWLYEENQQAIGH